MSQVPAGRFFSAGQARKSADIERTRALLELISKTGYQIGQKLPGERALSQELGVGRASLRESIKSLILLGVLEQRQGDGTYIAGGGDSLLPQVIGWGLLLNKPEIDELLEARQAVEVGLAQLAAQKQRRLQIVRLRELYDRMVAAGDDIDAFVEADVEFHMAIAAAAENQVLAGLLHNIRSLLRVWTTRVIAAAQETETALAYHLSVVNAIEEGDSHAANIAMFALTERGKRRLRSTLDDYIGPYNVNPRTEGEPDAGNSPDA